MKYLDDDKIEKLFYSGNPDDWKLASIYTIEKYKYQPAINNFLSELSKDYITRRSNLSISDPTDTSSVHIFVDESNWLQIVVGNYGLYCRSLARRPLERYNTVIEKI